MRAKNGKGRKALRAKGSETLALSAHAPCG